MDDTRALLIQRRSYNDPDLLEEFKALAQTAGYEVIGVFNIVSPPSAKYGIRKGKVEEIKTWIEIEEPDIVFFSPELKSSQIFRLMEAWEVEVRDRTQLILEIFDRHAQTPQAKLQIEQARLKYELPFERHQIRLRLQKEHTGDRPTTDQVGVGEDLVTLRITQLRRRIARISSKLEKISEAHQLMRKKRVSEGFLEVALAGYTNAGKSTLHDALTGSEVEIADELFTTLGTKSSSLDIPGRKIVLTDSVGFISNLPPSLLQAFNTTLMQITESDVIVLVIDGSDTLDEITRKVDVCRETFTQVGATGIPIIYALNKIDLLDDDAVEERITLLDGVNGEIIPISAMSGTNLDLLVDAIERNLPRVENYSITLPYCDDSMSVISWLHEVGVILHEEYKPDQIRVTVTLSPADARRLLKVAPECEISPL